MISVQVSLEAPLNEEVDYLLVKLDDHSCLHEVMVLWQAIKPRFMAMTIAGPIHYFMTWNRHDWPSAPVQAN